MVRLTIGVLWIYNGHLISMNISICNGYDYTPLASIPPMTAPRSTALLPKFIPGLPFPCWSSCLSITWLKFPPSPREVSCPETFGARRALRLILSF